MQQFGIGQTEFVKAKLQLQPVQKDAESAGARHITA